MRLFPIISIAMRVAVMAKSIFDMDGLLTEWDSSDSDWSDSDTFEDTTSNPKVREETKTGKIEPVIWLKIDMKA